MLVLILFSIIAAVMFHRKTVEKGYRSPRFWMYPLIVGNGMLLFTIALKAIANAIISDPRPAWFPVYGPVVDILAVVTCFAIIGKAWKQIQQLPPRQ
jgi:hypothetical protein